MSSKLNFILVRLKSFEKTIQDAVQFPVAVDIKAIIHNAAKLFDDLTVGLESNLNTQIADMFHYWLKITNILIDFFANNDIINKMMSPLLIRIDKFKTLIKLCKI